MVGKESRTQIGEVLCALGVPCGWSSSLRNFEPERTKRSREGEIEHRSSGRLDLEF